jgi:hypothetical protein
LAGTAATATAAAVWPVAVALAAMAVTEQQAPPWRVVQAPPDLRVVTVAPVVLAVARPSGSPGPVAQVVTLVVAALAPLERPRAASAAQAAQAAPVALAVLVAPAEVLMATVETVATPASEEPVALAPRPPVQSLADSVALEAPASPPVPEAPLELAPVQQGPRVRRARRARRVTAVPGVPDSLAPSRRPERAVAPGVSVARPRMVARAMVARAALEALASSASTRLRVSRPRPGPQAATAVPAVSAAQPQTVE